MDVREKLVEVLDEFEVYRSDVVAQALIESGVTVQEWISVKDRLPEMEQDVLVADNGFIAVWTFYGDYWEDSHGWWQEFDEVTHWMPLPEPPKGE